MTAFLTVTFDNSYIGAPGEALPAGTLAAQSGISVIEHVSIEQSALLPFVVMLNAAQTHLQVYGQDTIDDQSSVVGAGAGTTDALTACIAAEDLSTLTVKLMITGVRA